jgi:hypothetical protein
MQYGEPGCTAFDLNNITHAAGLYAARQDGVCWPSMFVLAAPYHKDVVVLLLQLTPADVVSTGVWACPVLIWACQLWGVGM